MKTAEAMLRSGRYMYTAFMCQQSIEKLIKAIYIDKFSNDAPRTHNLTYLISLFLSNNKLSSLPWTIWKLKLEILSFR